MVDENGDTEREWKEMERKEVSSLIGQYDKNQILMKVEGSMMLNKIKANLGMYKICPGATSTTILFSPG